MKIVVRLIVLFFVVIKLSAATETVQSQKPGKSFKQEFIENNLRAIEDAEQRKTLKLLRDHVEKGNIEFSENIEDESEKRFEAEQAAQKIRKSSKVERAEIKLRQQEDDEQRNVLKKLRDHVERENIVFTEFLEGDLDPALKKKGFEFSDEKVVSPITEHGHLAAIQQEREKDQARAQRRHIKTEKQALELEEKRNREKMLDQAYKSGRYAFLYKVPTWSLQALVHNKPDLIDIRAQYQEAVQMYGSTGKKQNIVGIPFGQEQMTVKDIFVASMLMATQGSLTLKTNSDSNPNPIDFLKDQVVVFDGWSSDLRLKCGYSRNLHDGDFSFGFNLPIVRRQNNLRFAVRLDDDAKDNVNLAKTQQLKNYGGTAEGYLLDVLSKKGIVFNGNETVSGLGDIIVFGTFQIQSTRAERILLSANFIFPTAQNRDTSKLWAPELGNGGFYGTAASVALLGAKNAIFNPHMFIQGTYFFPTSVMRRVPHYITKIATGVVPINSFIRQEEFTTSLLTAASFSQLDSGFREFADKSMKITIQKGFEFTAEVGNSIERFLFRQGFLDLFYHLKVKGVDSLGSAVPEDLYDPSVLFKNSSEFSHSVGFEHSYQFDRNVRSKFGARYTFAGRNSPELFEVTAALSAEF